MSKMDRLIEFMETAIESHQGIRVAVQMPDLPEEEWIWNPRANVPGKLEYYKKAYNEELELRSYPAIKITNYESIPWG